MLKRFTILFGVLILALVDAAVAAQDATICPWLGPPSRHSREGGNPATVELLGNQTPTRPVLTGTVTPVAEGPNGKPAFEVNAQQCGLRIAEPAFVGPDTKLTWSWRKAKGRVCILQLGLQNPESGAMRYLGYGAGSWSELPSADPTVEIFVSDTLPTEWTTVTRTLPDDIKKVLGWDSAKICEVYFSPWDGEPGQFAHAAVERAYAEDVRAATKHEELEWLSRIGVGEYVPPRLRNLNESRELKYDTHFEEAAPGRNSASNEWSAFGALGNNAFNCIGRDMRVRYPAYDLVFRILDAPQKSEGGQGVATPCLLNGDQEILPGALDSFRLGLVNGNLPAVWGGWEHGGLFYRVSVMAAAFDERGAYDLYRIEIQNPTQQPLESRLAAGLDGPPDMRFVDGVVCGLGDALFLLADAPQRSDGGQGVRQGVATPCLLVTRDWGLCDKRAKAYNCGGGPGKTEDAIATTRIGLDGLPVIYRFKAGAGKRFVVYLAASPHINRLLDQPKQPGDLVFKYEVEGASLQTLDWVECINKESQPLCLRFDGAHDANADGYIQVVAGCAEGSRFKHTRLSAIYVFPDGTKVDDPASVYSGAMNAQCVRHIDVGITPECSWTNQLYNTSDVGLCRLNLGYGGTVAPGEIKTYWLKVPPIHRRQPVGMGSIGHAFLDVLPGEAVPPFGADQLAKLRAISPQTEWEETIAFWNRFHARAAHIETPDPILQDMYLSRLATRAILDVKISDRGPKEDKGLQPLVWFNACSPWFYYDFAYRDQAYCVYAYDLAGLHDLSARLLNVYCMDVKDVPKGPIAFGEVPLQLGMADDGLWLTRPGQFDAQGQNLWCLVEHYKLSGDRAWLAETAYPYIKRGAQWVVHSRHKHMEEVKNPEDPRYGLIEPGAMEVGAVTKGMHMYYMDAWAVLGLREAADAARALGRTEDAALFAQEAADLRASLIQSCRKTFKRTGLYEGYIWFGVESEGDGMYGFWGHTPLLWPARAIDAFDPMLTATFKRMERMAHDWGGGMYSDGAGGCWPYIGVDWAISHILRGEPDKTLDYFCAFTDTAGLTMSWGEGYENARNVSAGDQPHMWADAQWVNLYRHLFVLEDGATLLLTPATMRRWQARGCNPLAIERLPTHFGDLNLTITPRADGSEINYVFSVTPKGDQASRPLDKIVVNARTPNGRRIIRAQIDGQPADKGLQPLAYAGETLIIPRPERNREYRVTFTVAAD